ncbi:MAG: hypothetical protein DRG66_08485, partial [Deltaproteobacteria bacterium]
TFLNPLFPGPDLACQDAAMESQAFITSENNCISTSRRASRSRPGLGTGRAGHHSSIPLDFPPILVSSLIRQLYLFVERRI